MTNNTFKPGTFVEALKTRRKPFANAKYDIIDDQGIIFLPVPISDVARQDIEPTSYKSLEEWRVATGLGDAKYDDFYNQLTISEHDIMEFIHLFKFGRPSLRSPLQCQSEEDFKMWKDNLMTNPAVFWSALAVYGRNDNDRLRQQIFNHYSQSLSANYEVNTGIVYKAGFKAPQKPLFENIKDFRAWYVQQENWREKYLVGKNKDECLSIVNDSTNFPEVFDYKFETCLCRDDFKKTAWYNKESAIDYISFWTELAKK